MTLLYNSWKAAGKPFRLAQPVSDFAKLLRGYGYTVGTIGNDRHLMSNPPEDHTPFSVTGWPNHNPYPYVHALDIMPKAGLPSLAELGARIVADRTNKVTGTMWIKYINWTDGRGKVWHESWEPGHSKRPSKDAGHIHISARTDMTFSPTATLYDPIAALRKSPTEVDVQLPTLRRGDRGQPVKNLQGLLVARGARLDLDGIIGTETEAAIKTAQGQLNVDVDGIVGNNTWTALLTVA